MEGFLGSELAENADYYMFVNKCTWLVCLVWLKAHLGLGSGLRQK